MKSKNAQLLGWISKDSWSRAVLLSSGVILMAVVLASVFYAYDRYRSMQEMYDFHIRDLQRYESILNEFEKPCNDGSECSSEFCGPCKSERCKNIGTVGECYARSVCGGAPRVEKGEVVDYFMACG